MMPGQYGAVRRSMLRTAAAAALGAAFTFGLAACDSTEPSFHNTDITGADIAKNGLELVDHTGATRRLEDYRGNVVAVFFGFTQCPDVCPTTLVELAETMKLLGDRSDKVQVLFVTVDPERDTPELLAKYVPAFDPRFVGLWGEPEAIARTAKDFKVFYQKSKETSPGSYSVDHTAGTYIFDPEGRVRLFAKHGVGPQPLAEDIGRLLGS